MRGGPLGGAFGSYRDQTRGSGAGSRPEASGTCNLTQRPLLMAAASFPTAAARYLQTRHVYSLPGHLSVSMRLNTTSLSSCRAGPASSSGASWGPFPGGNLAPFGASGGLNQNTIRGFLTVAASSLNARLQQGPLGAAPFHRCALILPGSLVQVCMRGVPPLPSKHENIRVYSIPP